MDIKEKFLQALKNNKGELDEITLGESLGLDEDSTMRIISRLLSEYRIDFLPDCTSNYRVKNRN